jgi:hypothetical protein
MDAKNKANKLFLFLFIAPSLMVHGKKTSSTKPLLVSPQLPICFAL